VRIEAGLGETDTAATHENIPLALLGLTTGCALVWSSLFTVGSFLYGRPLQGGLLLAVAIVSGGVLVRVINTLWTATPPDTAR